MKQHIDTKLGVVIILIFAVTVGAFLWKWEKNQPEVEQSQTNYNFKKPVAVQTPVVNQGDNMQNNNQANQQPQNNTAVGTKKYINKTYSFEFEYPSDLVIAQDATDSVFGLSNFLEGPWITNITVSDNVNNLSLNQSTDKIIKRFENYKIDITSVNVDGVPAKKYSVQNYGDNGNAGVIMIKGHNIITIYGDDSNSSLKKIFETVADSFKYNN
ncbi:MAG: PsbP-related protein [Parcubacteria group bacterium]